MNKLTRWVLWLTWCAISGHVAGIVAPTAIGCISIISINVTLVLILLHLEIL